MKRSFLDKMERKFVEEQLEMEEANEGEKDQRRELHTNFVTIQSHMNSYKKFINVNKLAETQHKADDISH